MRFSTLSRDALPGAKGGKCHSTATDPSGRQVGSIWRTADGWYAMFAAAEGWTESPPMRRRYDTVQWLFEEARAVAHAPRAFETA